MTQDFLGNNTSINMQSIIEEEKFKKIFLVTNKSSFINSGVSKYIYQNLVGCQYHRFIDFEVNPKFEDLERGLASYHQFKPDLIIGVGGGSALDMAKLIHYFSDQEKVFPHECQNPLPLGMNKNLPSKLMLLPTTSGSGSEATKFAVIYVGDTKFALDHSDLLADYCIVDGLLTEHLPRNVTAYTGIDALSQAIESFWAKAATDESRSYALKAIELIAPSLKSAVLNPTLEDREKMAIGSFYAGKAINITRTTAAHAFSYYLTTFYSYPHGHAVGLLLPYFIENNAKIVDLTPIFEILNVTDANEFKQYFIQLLKDIDLFKPLSKILKNDLDKFINVVNLERLQNNPSQLDKSQYVELFTRELE